MLQSRQSFWFVIIPNFNHFIDPQTFLVETGALLGELRIAENYLCAKFQSSPKLRKSLKC